MIEWIQPSSITWLGQTPPGAFIKEEKKELDTQEKILIVSVVISILGLAWSIYEWRTK